MSESKLLKMSFKISLSLRTALETIEKLSATLDFTDYSSQIIHAIVDILGLCICLYASTLPLSPSLPPSLPLSLSLSLSPPPLQILVLNFVLQLWRSSVL